ncbi:MAG TPA: hypothetical protein VFF65_12800, partial [Phycisphaerales bacterium]|nr:hypothetical protein [Phycisphaerales bacterium]
MPPNDPAYQFSPDGLEVIGRMANGVPVDEGLKSRLKPHDLEGIGGLLNSGKLKPAAIDPAYRPAFPSSLNGQPSGAPLPELAAAVQNAASVTPEVGLAQEAAADRWDKIRHAQLYDLGTVGEYGADDAIARLLQTPEKLLPIVGSIGGIIR